MDDLTAAVADRIRRVEVPLTVVPYAVTGALGDLLADTPARLVGPRPDLRARLDDKQFVRQSLARRGVPAVPSISVDLARVTYAELRERLGPDLVVQAARGSAGFTTTFVGSETDLARVRHPPTTRSPGARGPHLVAAHAGSCVLNMHLAIGASATLVSAASVQLAGLPAYGVPPPVYAGNDFAAAAALPQPLRHQAATIAGGVATWLAELGYRGIAGLDLVTDGTSCQVLEVNPRLQGSTWLLGEAQLRAGQPALLPAMVADQLWPVTASPPLSGAQLLLRRPFSSAATLPALPALRQPGVYRWRRGQLVFDRPAMGLLECGDDEVFVDGLTDLPAACVAEGAVVARIGCWQQLVETDGRRLTALGEAVAAHAYGRELV